LATNKSYIPEKDTEEAQKLIVHYLDSPVQEIERLTLKYGYKSSANFKDAIRRHYGILYKSQGNKVEIERHPIVELPPVNLISYKAPKSKSGDEEICILHCSDGHADKITKSYNKDIYRTKMGKLFQAAMKIITLHRNMYPIKKLVILNTGDNVQGENPHQGSKVGEVSMGARDQVKKLAAPMWNDMLGSFKQNFEIVEFHGVPGNHGHDKLAPETSSYDLLLYDVLESGIGQQKGIKVNVHEDWGAIIELWGYKIFMFHGDGIPCQQGVPFFALDKKLKSWHMQYGGFRYAFSGHFHKSHYNEVSSVLEHFMAGSLVSDDEWALKKLGISSSPSQAIYGLHPRHGITWQYVLTL